MATVDLEYCSGCAHLVNRKSGTYLMCGYLADTNRARGCPSGAGCIRHTKLFGDGGTRVEAFRRYINSGGRP